MARFAEQKLKIEELAQACELQRAELRESARQTYLPLRSGLRLAGLVLLFGDVKPWLGAVTAAVSKKHLPQSRRQRLLRVMSETPRVLSVIRRIAQNPYRTQCKPVTLPMKHY